VKHERPRPKGTKLAILLGIVWLLLLAATWFVYRNDDGDGGGFLNFLARFHIVIVHLPIGVIMLGAAMDILARFTALQHLRASLPFVYWIAFLGAIAATLAGYLLMSVEGFAGRAVTLHMYFGLAVVVFSLFALVGSLAKKWALSTVSILGAVAMAMASGHFGGAMVHDDDYLTEHAPESLKPLLTVGLADTDTEPEEPGGEPEGEEEIPLGERVVYTDFVAPILDAKCNECHDANKIKGDLRMDTYELLLAGAEGSDYPTIVRGDADQSEMIVRVTLPEDDGDFMPPKGEPLTPEEIELLSLWIKAGAAREATVADLGEEPNVEATLLAVEAAYSEKEEVVETAVATFESVWQTLSPEEQQARMDQVMTAAGEYNFSVMPVSAEDDRLRVNVINAADQFGDDQLAMLEPVAERVIWLDLARSQITDEGMEIVGKMRALERLHLENTAVTDAGIVELAGLTELEYLNLYGTQVTNGIFDTFATLPNLRRVYLWQTQVDPAAAVSYERSVNLDINTGVDLAAAVETPAEEEGEKAEEENKADEQEQEQEQEQADDESESADEEKKKQENQSRDEEENSSADKPAEEEKKAEDADSPPRPEEKKNTDEGDSPPDSESEEEEQAN